MHLAEYSMEINENNTWCLSIVILLFVTLGCDIVVFPHPHDLDDISIKENLFQIITLWWKN